MRRQNLLSVKRNCLIKEASCGSPFFGKKEVPSLFPTLSNRCIYAKKSWQKLLSNIVLYFQIRGFETVTRCKMCLHHGFCLLLSFILNLTKCGPDISCLHKYLLYSFVFTWWNDGQEITLPNLYFYPLILLFFVVIFGNGCLHVIILQFYFSRMFSFLEDSSRSTDKCNKNNNIFCWVWQNECINT